MGEVERGLLSLAELANSTRGPNPVIVAVMDGHCQHWDLQNRTAGNCELCGVPYPCPAIIEARQQAAQRGLRIRLREQLSLGRLEIPRRVA